MRFTRRAKLEAALERLRRENHALNAQMQRLVRTEQHLSVSRKLVETQVRKMEALNRFTLEASRAGEVGEVFDYALEMLFAIFPFEQGVAFWKEESGACVPIAIRSLPGREHGGTLASVRLIGDTGFPRLPKLGKHAELLARLPALRPLLEGLEAVFPVEGTEEGLSAGEAAVLLLPIHLGLRSEMQGAVLMRRLAVRMSLLEQLPQAEDFPVLSLLCAHLGSALQNLTLYDAVRRSEQEAHLRAAENERLYREAREAVHGRDEFLSLASHELKTPITPLKNELELIGRLVDRGELARYPPEKLKRLILIGDRELSRLSKLINAMLEVTRITSGRMILSFEPVSLKELVEEMVARLRTDIERAGSAVSLELRDGDPGTWDRLRIEQVVTNLLVNALKYGKGRPITLRSWTEGEKAYLVVEDQGIGIAPEDQQKIFHRFERAVTDLQAGGLGLGLYLTRQIVEAHQGTISVESAPGRGTVFTVEIPLRISLPSIAKAAA